MCEVEMIAHFVYVALYRPAICKAKLAKSFFFFVELFLSFF